MYPPSITKGKKKRVASEASTTAPSTSTTAIVPFNENAHALAIPAKKLKPTKGVKRWSPCGACSRTPEERVPKPLMLIQIRLFGYGPGVVEVWISLNMPMP